MDYQGRIIRPPSEADSILLQATTGCSHNKCAFCAAYKDKRFSIKEEAQVFRDIDEAVELYPDTRRLFLCDGDCLIMPMGRLGPLLERIRDRLPQVRRVASYANAKAIAMKTDQELEQLRELGLTMIYMGLESGHREVLDRMSKHGDPDFMVEQARRVRAAGMKLNVTVLLGLGGAKLSQAHARATGEVLTRMAPDQAAALTLMVVPGTPLHEEMEAGRFELPGAPFVLAELRTMLEHTDFRGLFLCNHASNYLPVRARLPNQKQAVLERIDRALAGRESLRPEELRRL